MSEGKIEVPVETLREWRETMMAYQFQATDDDERNNYDVIKVIEEVDALLARGAVSETRPTVDWHIHGNYSAASSAYGGDGIKVNGVAFAYYMERDGSVLATPLLDAKTTPSARGEKNAAPQEPNKQQVGDGRAVRPDIEAEPAVAAPHDKNGDQAFLCEAWARRVHKCEKQCDGCFRKEHEPQIEGMRKQINQLAEDGTREEHRLGKQLDKVDETLNELGAPKDGNWHGLNCALSRRGRIKALVSATRLPVTDAMVDRFLSWKLPEDFHPDAGISFSPLFNVEWNAKQGKPPQRHEPIGTNLLTATQARAMLEHVLGGAACLDIEGLIDWLDARGLASKVMGHDQGPTLRQLLREYVQQNICTVAGCGQPALDQPKGVGRSVCGRHDPGR